MTGRRVVRAAAIAAVAAAVLAAGGCGVPRDGAPRRLDPSAVPFGLLDGGTDSATPTPNGPVGWLYLVKADHLVAVPRHVPGGNRPAELVRDLLGGTRDEESARGLTTAIPARTRLLSLDLTGATATLDLSAEFGGVGGSDEVVAVAQLVYTVTQSPQIRDVRFSVTGTPVEVPDGSGSLSLRPRSRADYRQLLAAGAKH